MTKKEAAATNNVIQLHYCDRCKQPKHQRDLAKVTVTTKFWHFDMIETWKACTECILEKR